jgi:hypothetical protein
MINLLFMNAENKAGLDIENVQEESQAQLVFLIQQP